MDIVERLRGYDENDLVYKTDMIEAADEIEWLLEERRRLRQQNAELLAALKDMNGAGYAIVSIYRAAIAKTTGGE